MTTLLLLITIFGVSIQGVNVRDYGNRTGGKGRFVFFAISRLAGLLYFIITAGKLNFNAEILPYTIAFAIFYGACIVFNFLAINSGPLTITSLIISYSLMVPTAYGLIFLHDPISKGFVLGLILLLVSLYLINMKTEEKGVAITKKWIVYATIAFLGNGLCSTVQSMHVRAFEGAYKNEFMIIAYLLVVVFSLIVSFIKEKDEIKISIQKGWIFALICGVANAVVNYLTMVLQAKMPVSLVFPLMSGGGLVLTYFFSRFLFKEELSKTQNIGYILGVLSVIFLNI
ncbi:MAG: EamA family transporter [Clostridia bacterium]|nr:EamA family transporter [Clostridia bacterium]